MENQENKPYKITVTLSGNTSDYNSLPDGTFVFTPLDNKRTSETSAINAVKRHCSLGGCRVEKIIKIEKIGGVL